MMMHVERITKIVNIKFKTSMLKSSLCDYSDGYILVSGTITIGSEEGGNPNNNDKEVVFVLHALIA